MGAPNELLPRMYVPSLAILTTPPNTHQPRMRTAREGTIMKTKIMSAAIIAAAALMLTGCNGTLTTGEGERSVNSETAYTLKDGRTVTCIYGPSRLSCDWANAR